MYKYVGLFSIVISLKKNFWQETYDFEVFGLFSCKFVETKISGNMSSENIGCSGKTN